MAEGAGIFTAYGAIAWLFCFAARIVLEPQTVVPFQWWYAVVVFFLYLAVGAIAGLFARAHVRLLLVALFALNAWFQLSRFVRYWALGVSVLIALALIAEARLPARMRNITNGWFLSAALIGPLFAGAEVFYQRAILLRVMAAAVT